MKPPEPPLPPRVQRMVTFDHYNAEMEAVLIDGPVRVRVDRHGRAVVTIEAEPRAWSATFQSVRDAFALV